MQFRSGAFPGLKSYTGLLLQPEKNPNPLSWPTQLHMLWALHFPLQIPSPLLQAGLRPTHWADSCLWVSSLAFLWARNTCPKAFTKLPSSHASALSSNVASKRPVFPLNSQWKVFPSFPPFLTLNFRNCCIYSVVLEFPVSPYPQPLQLETS